MTSASNNSKLETLAAYLDGELSSEERALFEVELQNDVQLQAIHDQWNSFGDSVRRLPKHRLPASFADRVLAQIDNQAVTPASETKPIGKPSASGLPKNISIRSRSAVFGLIATLTAVVLLTWVITPLFDQGTDPIAKSSGIDNTAVEENTATENSAVTKDGVSPKDVAPKNLAAQDISVDTNLAQTNRTELKPAADMAVSSVPANDSDATDAVVPKIAAANVGSTDVEANRIVSPQMRRPMNQRPLAMKTQGSNESSGVVESLAPAIEQVFVLEFANDKELALDRLKDAFKLDSSVAKSTTQETDSIRIVENRDATKLQSQFIGGRISGSRAMVVMATNKQIKQAIEKLKLSTDVSVNAISLVTRNLKNAGSQAKSNARSTAQMVPVYDLSSDMPADPALDLEEAKLLDKWFGLAEDANSKQLRQFLILVK